MPFSAKANREKHQERRGVKWKVNLAMPRLRSSGGRKKGKKVRWYLYPGQNWDISLIITKIYTFYFTTGVKVKVGLFQLGMTLSDAISVESALLVSRIWKW